MKNSRLVLSLLSCLILAELGSGELAAQLTPTGPEKRVDTVPGNQYPKCPLIGVAADQSFEIAWGNDGNFPPEIKARHYKASGSPTDPSEVLVAALDYYPVTLFVTPVSTGFRVLMEVIDHVDAPRLPALAQAVFAHAAPAHVIVTTPNVEYNVRYEGLTGLRHHDHRFEWDRATFAAWAASVAAEHGYTVALSGVGEADPTVGAPTQLAVFSKC